MLLSFRTVKRKIQIFTFPYNLHFFAAQCTNLKKKRDMFINVDLLCIIHPCDYTVFIFHDFESASRFQQCSVQSFIPCHSSLLGFSAAIYLLKPSIFIKCSKTFMHFIFYIFSHCVTRDQAGEDIYSMFLAWFMVMYLDLRSVPYLSEPDLKCQFTQ